MRDNAPHLNSITCPICGKVAVRQYCMSCRKPVIVEKQDEAHRYFGRNYKSVDDAYFIEKRKKVAQNNPHNKYDNDYPDEEM